MHHDESQPSRADTHNCDTVADSILIHARSLHGVIAYARDRGADELSIQAHLEHFGLADINLERFDGYMSLNRFGLFMRALSQQLDDEAIGLSVCKYTRVGALGPLGNVLATSPDVNTALKALLQYMPLYIDVSYSSLSVSEERAEFSWAYSPLLAVLDHDSDRATLLVISIIRYFAGPDWRPLEVHLQRKTPKDASVYRELLAPMLRFEAPSNMIIFGAQTLACANPKFDRFVFEAAVELADRMVTERRTSHNLSLRVQEDVLLHMDDQGVNIDDTARRLGLSSRALQRGLDELNTSFQQLVGALRKRLAKELLTSTDLPIGEIAFRLGFSNQANFARAVKRWFDSNPRAIRQSVQEQGPAEG